MDSTTTNNQTLIIKYKEKTLGGWFYLLVNTCIIVFIFWLFLNPTYSARITGWNWYGIVIVLGLVVYNYYFELGDYLYARGKTYLEITDDSITTWTSGWLYWKLIPKTTPWSEVLSYEQFWSKGEMKLALRLKQKPYVYIRSSFITESDFSKLVLFVSTRVNKTS